MGRKGAQPQRDDVSQVEVGGGAVTNGVEEAGHRPTAPLDTCLAAEALDPLLVDHDSRHRGDDLDAQHDG